MDLRLLLELRTEIEAMDVGRYIVKARPGVLGGKFEEKRPLRERIEMPVKRHIFINRDSHPEANIYVAIHEAKNLPSQVPDYQVPHCHNTDEFYYFIGDNADLTGLEGQIIFEGRVHRIVSPACVYIPTGAVHEYKVTKGAGTVTVLFRDRGYTHEDRPFDTGKGERDFAKYAGYIFHPDVRPTTEIKYHSDAAPGARYVFIDGKLKPEAGFYTVVRSVANVQPTQANYVEQHTHNCDTQHIAIGKGAELTGLKIEFQIRDEKVVVESPMGVHIPAGTPHSQRIVEGSGHFFNFVPKSHYNDGLV
jgi:mannose-6-phosphate isomerase-like protein (cupin superfamily)